MKELTTVTLCGMPVRIVETPDGKFFVIRDICDMLGVSNPNRALSLCCNNAPKYERIRTAGGMQIVRLVPPADVRTLLQCNSGKMAKILLKVLFSETR